MRYAEKWGDSIESAVNLALQDLKLTREQVNVVVLEEPSKGFFGIGSKLAKVRVEEKEEPKVEKVEKTEEKPAPKKEKFVPREVHIEVKEEDTTPVPQAPKKNKPKKNNKQKTQKKENQAPAVERENVKVEIKHAGLGDKPQGLTPVTEHPAKEFLEKTFAEMKIEVTVAVETSEDTVFVDVEGKDTGTVIGKRGQTLDAIQYLTSLVVNKGEEEYIRVIVDAEGYRAKREATLEKLAQRLAEKVLKTGRPARLEPMNPYERKVIHSALQGVEGLNTRSEGDEPYRKVVIELKRK